MSSFFYWGSYIGATLGADVEGYLYLVDFILGVELGGLDKAHRNHTIIQL